MTLNPVTFEARQNGIDPFVDIINFCFSRAAVWRQELKGAGVIK